MCHVYFQWGRVFIANWRLIGAFYASRIGCRSPHSRPLIIIASPFQSYTIDEPEVMLQDLTKYITKTENYPFARGGFADVWKCIYQTDEGKINVGLHYLSIHSHGVNHIVGRSQSVARMCFWYRKWGDEEKVHSKYLCGDPVRCLTLPFAEDSTRTQNMRKS